MNAMVGDAGAVSTAGFNENNPYYVQFFKYSAIPQPAKIFVFLDEHPDSINDGYFLNKSYYGSTYAEWTDLPASYHNGAASFCFADGHAETHRWRFEHTRAPAFAEAVTLPMDAPKDETADFDWVFDRMTIVRHP
jgi:prepilin-type processing-associated H-X9-DG protein